MQKLCISCSCCCPDPAPQLTFERDALVGFGSTLPWPSAALGLLWCNSCTGDTGLLPQVASAGEITPTQFLFSSGYCLGCSLDFQTFFATSWFGFGEALGIEIVLVHIETSSCPPEYLALSPSVGRRSHCVFLKEKIMEMKRRISIFLFKCKEFDWGSLFPSFQHESLKIVAFLITPIEIKHSAAVCQEYLEDGL